MFKFSDFLIMKIIGMGTFGKVFLCKHKISKKYYAVKVMKYYEIIRLGQVDHVYDEKKILTLLRGNKYSVHFYYSFIENKKLILVMEYVPGGELFSYIQYSNAFNLETTRFYSSQLLLALQSLHHRNIVYRDLKPENILLDLTGSIKLTDFGFAKILDNQTFTFCGTPEYMSPEKILGDGHSFSADIWSLGILIYEMLIGSTPFVGNTPSEVYKKVLDEEIIIPENLDEDAKDLLQKILVRDQFKRLGNNSIDELFEHPFFKGYIENIDKMVPPIIPKVRYEGDASNFLTYTNDEIPLEEKKEKYFYRFL
ncbi:cAMP dependent protein kinase [Spraguea lophii 42_110]|uniref:cAMP-dependent protein kinase n=1 Tax=Spraguea lophii (strain 42_110) TaxID=1358809 RepID=S7W9F5_SPRLO|nr:cAMP dependent protein kinase [Spraguea lophii 42_110]